MESDVNANEIDYEQQDEPDRCVDQELKYEFDWARQQANQKYDCCDHDKRDQTAREKTENSIQDASLLLIEICAGSITIFCI